MVEKNRELIRAKREVEQRSRELNVLYETERQLSSAHDMGELLDRLIRQAMEMVGAEAGSIALRDAMDNQLRFRTTAGPAAEKLRDLALPMGEGIIGWVAARRQPVIVNHPEDDPRHAVEFATQVGQNPRSILCAPLIADDEGCRRHRIARQKDDGGWQTRVFRGRSQAAHADCRTGIAGDSHRADQAEMGQ